MRGATVRIEQRFDQVTELKSPPLSQMAFNGVDSYVQIDSLVQDSREEAVLKGLGCGLDIHPASIDVAATAPWVLHDLEWAGSVAALAVQRGAG